MPSTEDLTALVAIDELRSITAASKITGRSVQTISRLLSSFEAELGVVLFNRTTRNLRPTTAGEIYLARVRGALKEIELATEEVREQNALLSGHIRIAASTLFGPRYIVPALTKFMGQHQQLKVFLTMSDGYLDFATEKIDLAVRIGDLKDSALRARILGHARRVTIAAPELLIAHGEPTSPEDLKRLPCIVREGASTGTTWQFRVRGSVLSVPVHGPLRTDSAAVVNEAVVQGLGVGMAQLWQVRHLVEQGRVKIILQEFEPQPAPIQAIWPAPRQTSRRLRLLIDFLASNLKGQFD